MEDSIDPTIKTGDRADSSESGHASNGFSFGLRNLIPNHFGEFFEIFAFIIHRKWHHEIIEAVETVGHDVEVLNHRLNLLLRRTELRQFDSVASQISERNYKKKELLET